MPFYAKWTLWIVPLLLAACDPDESQVGQGDGIPLSITSVMQSGTSSGMSTRSTTFTGDIGLFRLSDAGKYVGSVNNARYSYSGSSWAAATTADVIYLTKNTATLCAYCPYSSSTEYASGTAVTLTSQEYATAKDLCYQTGVSASSTTAATFTLNHAYALITFTLTRGSTYPANGACAVSNISIANAGIVNTGSLNMTTGIYTQSTSGTAISYVPTSPSTLSTTGITSGGQATTLVLMAPVTITMSGNMTLTFTVDGKVMSTTLSLSTYTGLTTLAANTNYSIPITINGTALSVGTVSFTTGWTDQTVTTAVSPVSGSMVESNCYMVQPGATVYIPVSRATAGQKVATANSSYTLPTDWTTGLLWTDNSNGLSSSGAIAGVVGHVGAGYITVTAGSAEGNSVIYIKNATDEILWSWHIWTTDEPATEMVNGYVWMDRNLGATAVADGSTVTFASCGGLMYQWGRKDPFPGSNGSTTGAATALTIYNANKVALSSTNSDIPFYPSSTSIGTTAVSFYTLSTTDEYASQCASSVKYPLSFFRNWAGSTADSAANYTTRGGKSSWGGEYGESKSIFDPCPAGWRVPSGRKSSSTFTSPWSTWTTVQSITTSVNVALLWNANLNLYYYPVAGFRGASSGAFFSVGSSARYWSGSPDSSNGFNMNFYSSSVNPANSILRTNGFSVRCVQE